MMESRGMEKEGQNTIPLFDHSVLILPFQMDMMGQSVYEYSHPCDHEELRECLSSKPPENSEKRACSFFLRLKCTLTSKGRKVNLKSASYKVENFFDAGFIR